MKGNVNLEGLEVGVVRRSLFGPRDCEWSHNSINGKAASSFRWGNKSIVPTLREIAWDHPRPDIYIRQSAMDRPMDVTLKRIAKALFFDTDLKRLMEADKIITNKMKDRMYKELQHYDTQYSYSCLLHTYYSMQ